MPTLADIATWLGVEAPGETGAIDIMGMELDSRAVSPGDLYWALPGEITHGARYTSSAAENGACAVVTDPSGYTIISADTTVPVLVVDDPRAVMGDVAAHFYGDPAATLSMVGITGTNGKTTTAYLSETIYRATTHRPTAMIGTVGIMIGDERIPATHTTPESVHLHALLRRMRDNNVERCVMEVSSHALAQHRVDGVRFDVAGFTNLSRDHLDYHGTLEEYFEAKAELFTAHRAKAAAVMIDSPWGIELAQRISQAGDLELFTCGRSPFDAQSGDRHWQIQPGEIDTSSGGQTFTLVDPGGEKHAVRCPLLGDFNIDNAALAVVMAALIGITPRDAATALSDARGVPGRMEQVMSWDDGPVTIVDYAHTPDAVSTVLRSARAFTTGKLVAVLGAGGDRDHGKRELMGQAAAETADVVIITDDNPRSEEPASIRRAVLSGARGAQSETTEVIEIGDRFEAIKTAVEMVCVDAVSASGHTVVVAGKGHEQGQHYAGMTLPFDDRKVLHEVLADIAPDKRGGGPA